MAVLLVSSKQDKRTSKLTGLKIISSTPSNYSEMGIIVLFFQDNIVSYNAYLLA